MQYSLIQLSIAAAMVAVVVLFLLGWRRYLRANSLRRMSGMLTAMGLDPALATSADLETIMHEARDRCRHCPSESVCERWLAGEEGGSNEFCPNAKAFEILKKLANA